MKSKILTFIIGVLVGAIIATAGFFIYNKVNRKNRMGANGERPGMMQRGDGETPPEKPNGEQENEQEKPSNTTQNQNDNTTSENNI